MINSSSDRGAIFAAFIFAGLILAFYLTTPKDVVGGIIDDKQTAGEALKEAFKSKSFISKKISDEEKYNLALEYLDNVGLKEWATHLPSELSGGQKQRVAIARALVSKPKVLLADEPTGALDSKTSKEVMALIQDINKSGKTILIVTHEEDIAKMCSRIVRLKDGVILEDKKNKMIKAI